MSLPELREIPDGLTDEQVYMFILTSFQILSIGTMHCSDRLIQPAVKKKKGKR